MGEEDGRENVPASRVSRGDVRGWIVGPSV
jgi:hypothetical protein